MASILNKFWTRFRTKRFSFSIMIVGLDNSGKTSVLNCLARDKSPTCGRVQKSPPLETATNEKLQTNFDISIEQNFVDSSAESCQQLNATTRAKSSRNQHADSSALGGAESDCCADSCPANIMPTVGYNYERVQYKNLLALTVLDFSGQNKFRNLWQEFYNCVDAIVFVVDSSDLMRFVVVRDELENMLSSAYFATLQANNSRQVDDLLVSCAASEQLAKPNKSRVANQIGITQKEIRISQGKLIQTPLAAAGANNSDNANLQQRKALLPSIANLGSARRGGRSNTSPSSQRRTKVPLLFLANKTDLANSVETEVIVKALDLNQVPVERHPWRIQATSANSGQGIAEAFDWLSEQLLSSSAASERNKSSS